MENKKDPRLHIITVTGIIEKDGKYLILKRAENEIAFPGFWTVPGGKIVRHEYETLPKTPNSEGWYKTVEFTLRKEIKEESNLEVDGIKYLTDMTFIRPDNVPVVVLSYYCKYKSGEVKLGKDMTDFVWISPEEGEKYKIIPGILDEIKEVNKILKS